MDYTIKETTAELVQNVLDGVENPLKAFAILSDLEKHIKDCKEAVKEEALDEANKYDKTFVESGFKFERRNGGARYSFSHIEEVKLAKDKVKALETKYKTAYKNAENGIQSVDENGELLELPKVTYSSDSLIFKGLE